MTSTIYGAALDAVAVDDGLEIIELNRASEFGPDLSLQRAESLARRLRTATYLLRLDQILLEGWAVPTDDGLTLGHLPLRQADALVRILEDLAADRQREPAAPGPGQLSLFGEDER